MVESTAAALGYGLLCAGSKSILVVDIGGGTTDVTITAIKDHCLHPSSDDPTEPAAGAAAGTGVGVEVKVMATAGHSQVFLSLSPLLSLSPTLLLELTPYHCSVVAEMWIISSLGISVDNFFTLNSLNRQISGHRGRLLQT
jgi:hypothetical protein